jgi:Tol biopolymer transport system component
MKRVLVLGLLLSALACGRTDAPAARSLSPEGADHVLAGYSPDGARVYWWQHAGDAWQLYRSPSDMSAPEPIALSTMNPGEGTGTLLWSPDGTRFAVAATQTAPFVSVWVVSAAGRAPRRVSPEGGLAGPLTWNPDGKRLLYLAVLDRNFHTMVVNVDSGAPVRILPNESSPHIAFWSPDGSKLAIQVIKQGHSSIWLADGSGGQMRQVTSEGFESIGVTGFGRGPWSPDGSALLYTSTRSGTSDVWVLPASGSPARQLTQDVRDDKNPVWSADSRWVAFESNRGLQNDLWVVPAAGGDARRVTDDARSEVLLGWRPGTNELAYTTGRLRQTLWAHTLSSGAEHQLTPDSLDVSSFSISSRGVAVISIARGGGVADIATLPLGGGAPQVILRDSRADPPHWSPDGSRLVFLSTRAGANKHAWIMDADGSGLRRLTSWKESEGDVLFTDDSTIHLVSDHQSRFGDAWRVRASGGEPVRVTATGGILGLCWQPQRPAELFMASVADAPVTIAMVRLVSGRTLQPVWDRTAAGCALVSPTVDSVFMPTTAGPDVQNMLLPLGGGPGRMILERNQIARFWSPDGRQILFSYSRTAPYDLGILTVADGSVRRITQTPESEDRSQWSPDGSALVFIRTVPISRITTMDITQLLGKPVQGR